MANRCAAMQVMSGEPAVRACGCDGFTLGHWPLIVAAVLATALHVVRASSDGTARIWDAPSGKEIAVLQVHDSGVWSAAISRPRRDRSGPRAASRMAARP